MGWEVFARYARNFGNSILFTWMELNLIAPDLKGIFNFTQILTDDSKIIADEAYLLKSIRQPQQRIVKGDAGAMPTLLLTGPQIYQLVGVPQIAVNSSHVVPLSSGLLLHPRPAEAGTTNHESLRQTAGDGVPALFEGRAGLRQHGGGGECAFAVAGQPVVGNRGLVTAQAFYFALRIFHKKPVQGDQCVRRELRPLGSASHSGGIGHGDHGLGTDGKFPHDIARFHLEIAADWFLGEIRFEVS